MPKASSKVPALHACVLLKDKTAKRGGELVGEFCERLETDGSVHEINPADAPWQNGRTEHHGGTVKLMITIITRARISLPPRTNKEDLEELLVATRRRRVV
eukprot:4264656-Amphidinium_carterae.1